MAATLTTFELPLRLDAEGTIRIGQTRVTLDLVMEAFRQRISPDEIARQFPAISLAEVYGAIAYYLQHQVEIDTYLQARTEAAAPLLQELADQYNPVGLRESLRARQGGRRHDGG